MSSMKYKEAMWVSFDQMTYEHLRLSFTADSITADGWILQLGQTSNRIRYKISCDALWRVRKLEVMRQSENDSTLILHSDGQGHWTNEEYEPVRSLNACIDVDIYASPFTNTLPIRRLQLKPQESQIIPMAFVELPDLRVTATRQRYTLLRQAPDGSAVYLFEGLESNFTTELPVDADGLVVEYPKFFKRIWTAG
jgi:uncharacterized protein